MWICQECGEVPEAEIHDDGEGGAIHVHRDNTGVFAWWDDGEDDSGE